MSPTPIALPPALPSELLEYVLAHQAYPTTLLICQPRAIFLSSLLQAINHTSPSASSLSSSPPAPETKLLSDHNHNAQAQRHPLLIPTLHQVATSRQINLVFIPTVTHLRAYLAVFPRLEKDETPLKQEWDKKGKNKPLLAVYGVVGLHKDTSEWSAQGLGNSLAAVVQAGLRGGRKVVLIEERKLEDEDEGERESGQDVEDEEDGERSGRGCRIWEEKVPILNGIVRRPGLESEHGGWSGRTVEVGRLLARWVKFRNGDWDRKDGA